MRKTIRESEVNDDLSKSYAVKETWREDDRYVVIRLFSSVLPDEEVNRGLEGDSLLFEEVYHRIIRKSLSFNRRFLEDPSLRKCDNSKHKERIPNFLQHVKLTDNQIKLPLQLKV